MHHFHKLQLKTKDEVTFLGPPLNQKEQEPLPALFYFALSAEDSLLLDPFNQPAAYLSSLPLRIFSLTLPGHENHLPPTQALTIWAKELEKGKNPIATFIEKVRRVTNELLDEGIIHREKLAVSGLSRGAFIATHVAASIPYFRTVLGFAPLTKLQFAKEFEHIRHLPLVEELSLENLTDLLTHHVLRFYIGNIDMRVSTRNCFDFIEKLSLSAYHARIRSPLTELIIYPSIGHQGHGTPQKIFHAGADWVREQLGISHGL